ncbi:unnamed protein product [Victoria cruziana]
MAQTCLFLLLTLLVTLHGAAIRADDFGSLELNEAWSEDEEVEDEKEKAMAPRLKSSGVGVTVVNVDSLGAMGDAIADDTEAFANAWKVACNVSNAVLLVPEGRRYLVKPLRFKGPCADNLLVQIAGEIVAPDEPNDWDPKNPKTWLVFSGLKGVSFQGGGIINGSGTKWWASSCKINKKNAFTILSSSAVSVSSLSFKDSQQIHFTVSHSDAVRIIDVNVEAPGDSPNTDGIHISQSTNVLVQNVKIGTGDDCISIVNGTSNIKMKNIVCGPGHGISVGSLGKDNSTAAVTAIVLDTAVLADTTNGVRIKTWQGGSGYVRALRFQNIRMNNVSNPIIIDQFYCDSPSPCQNQTSAVSVSQVMYINISGTSRSAKAIKFACSDTVPCSKLFLANINLQTDTGTAETFCNSAIGFKYGSVVPSVDCLLNSDKSHIHKHSEDLLEHRNIHTEL